MRLAHDAGVASTLRTHGRDGTPCAIRRVGVLDPYWIATVLGDAGGLAAGSLDVALGVDVSDDAVAAAVPRLLALSARGIEVTITHAPPRDDTESAVVRWHCRPTSRAPSVRVAHG